MAITTYAELQAAVTSWTNRSDLAAVIPDFIALAEGEFNAQLRLPGQESADTLTCTTRLTALPTDFLMMRRAVLATDPIREFQFASSASLGTGAVGESYQYSITEGQFELYPAPDASTDVDIEYIAKIAALTDLNTTNFLLTAYPFLYLFGSLVQAAFYLDDANMMSRFAPKYKEQMEMVKRAGREAKQGHSMAIRVG
jgi:hypothetical protein